MNNYSGRRSSRSSAIVPTYGSHGHSESLLGLPDHKVQDRLQNTVARRTPGEVTTPGHFHEKRKTRRWCGLYFIGRHYSARARSRTDLTTVTNV